MNLNFTLSELIKSDAANKYNINNMPDIISLDNLLMLIFYCLQPIRNKLNKPMLILSGYRCAKVNQLVKGSPSSQHTKGEAVDFWVRGMTISQIIDFIKKSDIEFDQLINEYDRWVHISYVQNKNRCQILKIT